MEFKINKPIASNARDMDEADIRNLKIALNRLGYYEPPKDIGITSIPDRMMFDSLEAYRKFNEDIDYTLPDSIIRPGDNTVQELNRALKTQPKGIKYKWMTVGDDKVRSSHAALDGEIREFGSGLQPGDEPNCHCWAEPVGNTSIRGGGKFSVPEPPENPNLRQASVPMILWNGLRLTASACAANSACRAWAVREGIKIVLENTYHLPPKALPAFPDAKKAEQRGARKRWIDSRGKIYEWDSQHGEVEVYDKTGKKHEGGFDPETGKRRSKPDPKKKVEK